eukprot:Hpha_TRINITY_DN8623_c0_g1::TRINITY_DN8623_c0_g1_i2::g.168822::m.168822
MVTSARRPAALGPPSLGPPGSHGPFLIPRLPIAMSGGGGQRSSPPAASAGTTSPSRTSSLDPSEEDPFLGPPAALHDVCRQIAELVTTLVRGLSTWQQRAVEKTAAGKSEATMVRELLEEARSKSRRLEEENERLLRENRDLRRGDLDKELRTRLKQCNDLLEQEESLVRQVRLRNEHLERERSTLLNQIDVMRSPRGPADEAAIHRLIESDAVEKDPSLYRGLVRVFVEQLRVRKCWRRRRRRSLTWSSVYVSSRPAAGEARGDPIRRASQTIT